MHDAEQALQDRRASLEAEIKQAQSQTMKWLARATELKAELQNLVDSCPEAVAARSAIAPLNPHAYAPRIAVQPTAVV